MSKIKIRSIVVEDGMWKEKVSQAIEEGYNIIVVEFTKDKDEPCHIYTPSKEISEAIKSKTDWEEVNINNLIDCFWARSGDLDYVFGKLGDIFIYEQEMIVA